MATSYTTCWDTNEGRLERRGMEFWSIGSGTEGRLERRGMEFWSIEFGTEGRPEFGDGVTKPEIGHSIA